MFLYKKSIIAQLIFALVLIAKVSQGHTVFKPKIVNHGTYKNISSEKNLVPLEGHVPLAVKKATKDNLMDQNNILKISLMLPLKNEEQLAALLHEISNPKSEKYGQHLTQKQFIDTFCPSLAEVESITKYLTDRGITIKSTEVNRLLIQAEASVKAINEVFNTEIHSYTDEKGREFFAPAYELQVEPELKILSVLGLENHIKAHSQYKLSKKVLASKEEGIKSAALGPNDIKKAYSLTSNLNGSGQVLALFELDGFNALDVTAYENSYGLPHVPLQTILIDGATGIPGDGAGEVTLDIELMIALAPGAAKILVYEGPNNGKGLIDTYSKIANDNLAKTISTSWGLSETENSGSILQAENQIFKQMAAQGQVLYAAAGDSGAYDDGSNLSVDDPASQPYVVGVGGTKLFLNSDGSYSHETTWSSGNGPGNEGGGGGKSVVWSIPSWQQGSISSASLGSTTMRNVPDVSLDSDPNTGYLIYFAGKWQIFGGTSCAAPLWAAFTALVNQNLISNNKPTLSFPNPSFYQLGQSANYSSLFHDIKDNSKNGYYPAVVGYDLATGLGTFIADALITALSGTNVTPPPPPPPPPTQCTQANPSITLSPTTQTTKAGTFINYTVNVTNNNSSQCQASTIQLTAQAPSTLFNYFDTLQLKIDSGSSKSTKFNLYTSPLSSTGAHDFTVTATIKGATNFNASAIGEFVISQ